MIEQFKEDICNLADDYNRECETSTLNEVTEYVMDMLLQLGYDKKKHIFDRFIRQIIAYDNINKYGQIYNDFIIENKPEIVEFIGTLPQHEQRTEEWYAARKDSIGASESSAIFGMNPYESVKKLILKKCGVTNPGDQKRMKAICEHGIKYEAVIQDMYCRDKSTTIVEFGSIRHQSAELSMVTASPDGITPEGIMLEIKAPALRHITGIPTSYYWVQCQQQMQVCQLDIVHFLEVKIQEYTNFDDYVNDNNGDTNSYHTSNNLEKGVVLEYHKLDEEGEVGYVYPEQLLKADQIKQWCKDQTSIINNQANKQVRRLSYWKCCQYCLTEIYKDQDWWDTNVSKFKEFWEKVIHYRNNGHDDLLPKKRTTTKSAFKPKCLIDSDDDQPVTLKKNVGTYTGGACLIDSDDDQPVTLKKNVVSYTGGACLIDSDDDQPVTLKKNAVSYTGGACLIDSDDD